jgi:hypothetical protein
MNRSLKTGLLPLIVFAVGALSSLQADSVETTFDLCYRCNKLGQKNIKFPGTIVLNDSGKLTGTIDLHWLETNYVALMRTAMPAEGGSGGDRYSYSGWNLSVNDAGEIETFVHIKLRNYKYTKVPPVSIQAGTVDVDVRPIIKAKFDPETKLPDFDSATVRWNQTGSGGIAAFVNNILPRRWFSLSGLVRKRMDATVPSGELLERCNEGVNGEDWQQAIGAALKKGTLKPMSASFKKDSTGLQMVFEYQVDPDLAPLITLLLKRENS